MKKSQGTFLKKMLRKSKKKMLPHLPQENPIWLTLLELQPQLKNFEVSKLKSVSLKPLNGKFITSANLDNLATKSSIQPVFLGTTDESNIGPYMVIRYIDSQHNKKAQIPDNAKTFTVVQFAMIASVGIELMATEHYFWKRSATNDAINASDPEKAKITTRTLFFVDGGISVAKTIADLLMDQNDNCRVI